MNGFYLLFPFLIVRFGLLSIINKEAIQRAGYFAPVQGQEKGAYYIYQVSNIVLFLYLFVTTIKIDFSIYFYLGFACYCLGIALLAISIACFVSPNAEGLNINGIYQLSRNPMYVAYFICFMGMSLLTQSLLLFGIVIIFQISAHWIILSEERWCVEKFGNSYKEYMKKVRRYI
ncbi:methyltransferase family protein [Thomasclavelia cocleata]|uniref:methyltransferase family protein n=1 Tax=Thomasclavelia cocleata TaxID=69824 RepID=UPI00272E553F|nr:isoprenylcysteine carboxylmethyltransferase family protein [Thomasclavelia cocleata]